MDGAEKFSLFKHIGEYLREGSVLILIFGFLDPLVPESGAAKHLSLGERFAAIPTSWSITVLAVSLGSLIVGILLEWIRLKGDEATDVTVDEQTK